MGAKGIDGITGFKPNQTELPYQVESEGDDLVPVLGLSGSFIELIIKESGRVAARTVITTAPVGPVSTAVGPTVAEGGLVAGGGVVMLFGLFMFGAIYFASQGEANLPAPTRWLELPPLDPDIFTRPQFGDAFIAYRFQKPVLTVGDDLFEKTQRNRFRQIKNYLDFSGEAEPAKEEKTETKTDEREKGAGECPTNSVYVPHLDLCFEEHEHTEPGSRMPQVHVTWAQSAALCAGMRDGGLTWRLPSSQEWVSAASNNEQFGWSTRDGNWNGPHSSGVHFRASSVRPVCAAAGHYIEYGGKDGQDGQEICDMSGNVAEWTSDSFIVGGWFGDQEPRDVRADFRLHYTLDDGSHMLGYRCAASLPGLPKSVGRFKVIAPGGLSH